MALLTHRFAVAILLALAGASVYTGTAAAAPCDNGPNRANCDFAGIDTEAGASIGPISVFNSASCVTFPSQNCGDGAGVGAASVFGDASCTSYDDTCGTNGGIGAVSVIGDANCNVPTNHIGGYWDCGFYGVGAVSVLGNARCDSQGYDSCGFAGIGALSVLGDASCSGDCGSLGRGTVFEGGFGAVSVAGHASCDTPFDVNDPFAVGTAQCIGGKDVLQQLGVPV